MAELGRRRVEEELAWEYSIDNLRAAYERYLAVLPDPDPEPALALLAQLIGDADDQVQKALSWALRALAKR